MISFCLYGDSHFVLSKVTGIFGSATKGDAILFATIPLCKK